ncbi:MAG: M23 family metallopeptidase [Candidatus Porifericomitaceae bacterium WSBS_2022_MAG_OTU9]
MRLLYCVALLCMGFTTAAVAEPVLDGVAVQGGLMRGKVAPGSEIKFNDTAIRVSANGNFIIGFGRDEPKLAKLDVRNPDGSSDSYQIMVAKRSYEEQHINGLPSNKVTPNKNELQRIKKESQLVGIARSKNIDQEWFTNKFVWPLYGRISGVYGSRRILNGNPRRPHYGVDIAAPTGTQIRAPADGVVTLAHSDMFFSGGTLIIDHGHGLSSTMMHLSRILIQEGDLIKQGDLIAEVGATGRATGPHLDWRMNLLKRRVDPQMLTGPMPIAY